MILNYVSYGSHQGSIVENVGTLRVLSASTFLASSMSVNQDHNIHIPSSYYGLRV
jgi:hypothetical protein